MSDLFQAITNAKTLTTRDKLSAVLMTFMLVGWAYALLTILRYTTVYAEFWQRRPMTLSEAQGFYIFATVGGMLLVTLILIMLIVVMGEEPHAPDDD